MEAYHFILLALGLAATDALVVETTPCPQGIYITEYCKISEVRIDPCDNPKKCLIKKNPPSTISVDFTTIFNATKLNSRVAWDTFMEVPLDDKSLEGACEYTTCPIIAGNKYTFNYELHLSPRIPRGNHGIIWSVWNESNRREQCCFRASSRIYNH